MVYIPGISDLYNLVQGLFNWLTGQPITDIYNFVTGIPETIGTLIFYPITAISDTAIYMLTDLTGHVLGPIVATTNLVTAMLNIVNAMLSNFWPVAWVTLVGTGFTIILAVRAYHFLKDISIMGNKI